MTEPNKDKPTEAKYDDRLRVVQASDATEKSFVLRKVDVLEMPPLEEELIEPNTGAPGACSCNSVCGCVPVNTCSCDQVCACDTVSSCPSYSSGCGGGGGGGGYYAPCH